MRSRGNSCIEKRKTDCTERVGRKRDHSDCKNTLYIIGIGPGSPDHLSQRAYHLLKSADTIVGYKTYIDLIRPVIKDKNIISTAMTKEIERVSAAIDAALTGKKCAIVSSGDPGVYAMAGLLFEMCREKEIPIASLVSNQKTAEVKPALYVEVVPGIPALCSGAALLGSPVAHDFAAISLSNLLTPWELIEKRLEAAAAADFVIVLYNPKSRKRDLLLEKAQKIILNYRSGKTPVGIVTSAMRDEQGVKISSLENLHTEDVNMQTTIFVGSSASSVYLGFMVTPRGYSKKYAIGR
ncbi:MAG TPA: precorrin-3B C(17)-methyltransferase [Desulfobacteraceae bacterium]|nr:precorrin-3B C(17)-methyltransferase [Desulfobacteraceae bacterium]